MHSKHLLLAVLAGSLNFQGVIAHSWVEQLNVIAPNGTMVDPAGFPRGNVRRGMPGFGDDKMVWLIPPNSNPINQINADQMMCRPEQRSQTQPDNSPRLKAAPGASVALRYQENGHVTLPENQKGKPANRGTNFVYYTDKASTDDKFLQIHRIWNTDGSGGDRRGRLISTRPFDDGQCYQINGEKISQDRQAEFKKTADQLQGANLWCQQDILIPTDAKPGSTITLYWIWDWPTMPGTEGFPNGKQEIYTTCMDIDIVDPSKLAGKLAVAGQAHFVNQDLGNAAVVSQFKDIANPTGVAQPDMIPFSGASSVSSSPTQAPSASSSTLKVTSSPVRTTTLVPAGPSSASVSAVQSSLVPATVTMTVTVTEKASSSTPTGSAAVVTETETVDMITMTISNTIRVPSATVTLSALANSKLQSVYRLRARAPFYALSSESSTTSSSSSTSATPNHTGC